MLFPQKSIALAQLKLIDKVIVQAPEAAAQAVGVVAVAFGHSRQDVQEAALALIARRGVPAGCSLGELRLRALDLSPSLRPKAAALGLAGAGDDSPEDAELAAGLAGLEQRIKAIPVARAAGLVAALAIVRRGEVPAPVPVEPSAGPPLQEPVTDQEDSFTFLLFLWKTRGMLSPRSGPSRARSG